MLSQSCTYIMFSYIVRTVANFSPCTMYITTMTENIKFSTAFSLAGFTILQSNLVQFFIVYFYRGLQRPCRRDRLPRAYFCCRQLAKFGIVRGICLYNMLVWLVCYNPTLHCFPDCGVWVSVDFDSKYKILWGVKLGPMGYLFKKKKKV